MKKGRKKKHACESGPLHSKELMLLSEGTLVFTLDGQKGRYNRDMIWEKAK